MSYEGIYWRINQLQMILQEIANNQLRCRDVRKATQDIP